MTVKLKIRKKRGCNLGSVSREDLKMLIGAIIATVQHK
jgi:hypothetical protein